MNDVLKNPSRFTVLLVDDDDVSSESVVRSFHKLGVNCHTILAGDGMEALDILRNQHPSKTVSDSLIVLLDLNMPRMDGFGFLEAVRSDPKLKGTVIFVLTTSARDTDRTRAYNENVAGYMVKSAVGPQFSLLAGFLDKYAAAIKLP